MEPRTYESVALAGRYVDAGQSASDIVTTSGLGPWQPPGVCDGASGVGLQDDDMSNDETSTDDARPVGEHLWKRLG
jgi:hypothetical protein